MKKIILSLAAVLVFTLTSDAQTRKGTILLGAGSEISNSLDTYDNGRKAWTMLNLTPKVGYFVQDGVAVGALINFQSNNEDLTAYELNHNIAEIGVFGRYYVANNLFAEVSLSSLSQSVESWELIEQYAQVYTDGLPQFIPDGPDAGDLVMAWQDIPQVVEESDKSLNFCLFQIFSFISLTVFSVPTLHGVH